MIIFASKKTMDILKFPSDISLSGNMQKCIISTPYDISFVLIDDTKEETIIEHSYSPSADHLIEVDLKPIIQPLLSFNLQNVTTIYQQPDIMHSFTVNIAEVVNGVKQEPTSRSFKVFRTGVDELADAPLNFLKSNFLTWQPSVKGVTYYSPEFLTYYASEAVTVKCTAYFPSAPSATSDLASLSANTVWTIPVSYSVVASKFDGQFPSYYDIWIETSTGNRLTYIQRYYADDMKSPDEQWVLFENSLGGIDTFRAYGNSNNTAEHTHNIAEIEEDSQEYRVDTERSYSKNTGYLDKKERLWLLDFFPSLGKYIYLGNHLRRIVVTESEVNYTAKDLPSSYTFTYKYADARPYLNIPRVDKPQEVLNISVPELGSFTIAPRLVEFPRLSLSGGALLPIQDPYSEGWNTTSIDSIFDYIFSHLQVSGAGGGGVGHTHDNMSLLMALAIIDNYLCANGDKIKAGYADKAGQLDENSDIWNKFIRKDVDDKAAGLITFIKGLVSKGTITALDKITLGEYVESALWDGKGGCLDKDGNAWLRNLTLAESLTVPKLSYNMVEICPGIKWQSAGGGTIKEVEVEKLADGSQTINGTITLDLKEGEIGQIAVGDLCMALFHSIAMPDINATEDFDSGTGTMTRAGFYTCYFRITDILETHYNSKARYVLRNDYIWPYRHHPSAQMIFVAYANPEREERQQSCYQTTTYTRYLSNVTTWEFETYNIAMQLGDLSNLSVFGYNLQGYSAFLNNAYITGHIEQIRDLRTYIHISGLEDSHIEVGGSRVVSMWLERDNHNHHDAEWAITRESGLPEADAEWNEAHKNVSSPLTLTSEDMGEGAYLQAVMFTFAGKKTLTDDITGNTTVIEASSSVMLTLVSREQLHIEFQPVEGKSYVVKASNVDTIIEARLYFGQQDITDTILLRSSTTMKWTRDSGIPTEDAAWTATTEGSPNIIHIIDRVDDRHDCGSYWMENLKVIFAFECNVVFAAEEISMAAAMQLGNS